MDAVEKKVEGQIQFWSLLGPALILLSITVLLFKVSDHWVYPVSALIGILLCVKWKMKGMVAALGCLFLLSGIGYQNLELDDRYWHVGLALTMAFSFIVLTLSLEEVEGLIRKLQLESQSRLDNFVLLDEKWKIAELEWTGERERSQSEIASLTQEMSRTQEEKQTFYKLTQLAKDELVQVRGQHDLLLQDLSYKKQQIAQLHERLEETEITIQGFINSDVEKNIQSLTERLSELDREKETWKAKVALIQSEGKAYQEEKEQLKQELQASQEREKSCLLDQHFHQQARIEQQNAFQSLQHRCTLLEQEKNALLQTRANLQQQLEQVQYLEDQHRQATQLSQQKIQDLKAGLFSAEKQKEALQKQKKECEGQILSLEKQFEQQEEHYKLQLQKLYNQLEEQKEKTEAHLEDYKQQTFQHTEHKYKGLEEEKRVLQERFQKSQEDLLRSKQELESKNRALSVAEAEIEKLSEDLSKQHEIAQNAAQQMQRLDTLKSKFEESCLIAETELNSAKQKLDSVQQNQEKLPYATGNTRRIEAMYIQLQDQFKEKCAVLDTTRRELFHANEELLKRKRELEEEKIFGQSLNEIHFQRNLLQLGRKYEQVQQHYQQEIEDLTQLVEHLLRQMSA